MTDTDIKALAGAIDYHRQRYTLGDPEIDDAEYDNMVEQLKIAAPGHPSLSKIGSPIDRFDQPVHYDEVMGSLDSTRDYPVLERWLGDCANGIIASLKIDGLALELRYENGYLVQAGTRGEGMIGKDVTLNATAIADIPQQISYKEPLRIRGECYLRRSALAAWNEKHPEAILANCRNGAVGSLKQRNARITAQRGLSFMCYDIRGKAFATEIEKLEYAEQLGFTVVPAYIVDAEQPADVLLEAVAAARDSLDFDIDGIVFAVADTQASEALGYRDNCPRGKRVWKFTGLAAETKLLAVDWAVGKTGVIAPTGIVEPVSIGGCTVQHVTLNNPVYIQELGIMIGSRLLLEKANDVIPHVRSVNAVQDGDVVAPVDIPLTCPECGGKLVMNKSRLFCANNGCSGQVISRLVNWCKKTGFKGVSRATLETMMDDGFELDNIAQFCALSDDDWIRAVGKRRAATLMINKAAVYTAMPLATFLGALGIPMMCDTTAKRVAAGIVNARNLMHITQQDLEAIPDVKTQAAAKIYTALLQRKEELAWLVENMDIKDHVVIRGRLTGQRICITGARGNLEALIAEHGGDYSDTMGKNCTLLIVGTEGMAGDKVQRATLLGIPIKSAQQFIEELGSNG